MTIAFVLPGGARLGSVQVGMVRALNRAGVDVSPADFAYAAEVIRNAERTATSGWPRTVRRQARRSRAPHHHV
jgi:uncharacterized protein with von Willebrand factor type A (vWA) domain